MRVVVVGTVAASRTVIHPAGRGPRRAGAGIRIARIAGAGALGVVSTKWDAHRTTPDEQACAGHLLARWEPRRQVKGNQGQGAIEGP
eukprot:scaffold210298_cov28-Tisochrysis_lutea.AAC.2